MAHVEIEERLRNAARDLAPSPPTEERAMRAAIAALPQHGARESGRLTGWHPVLSFGRRRRAVVLILAAAVAIAAVLATWKPFSSESASSSVIVTNGGGGRFPAETFTDWVSYSDQVSLVSIVGEHALPAEMIEPGDSYVPRIVDVRIDDTIWRRREAPAAEGVVRVLTYGWALRDGEGRPVGASGGPRLTIGQRYLMPLVRAPRDGVEWTPLAVESTLPLDGNTVTLSGILGTPSLLARDMAGRQVSEVESILSRTKPDPVAAKYFDRPPDQRWQAVRREKFGGG
jgi:hypothetical protein